MKSLLTLRSFTTDKSFGYFVRILSQRNPHHYSQSLSKYQFAIFLQSVLRPIKKSIKRPCRVTKHYTLKAICYLHAECHWL